MRSQAVQDMSVPHGVQRVSYRETDTRDALGVARKVEMLGTWESAEETQAMNGGSPGESPRNLQMQGHTGRLGATELNILPAGFVSYFDPSPPSFHLKWE